MRDLCCNATQSSNGAESEAFYMAEKVVEREKNGIQETWDCEKLLPLPS